MEQGLLGGMLDQASSWSPVLLALAATMFTWLMTALGALPVLFMSRFNQRLMDVSLGMAAGIMLAASFWSLLAPALELTNGSWHVVTAGFLAGAGFLLCLDKVLPHLHPGLDDSEVEGVRTSWQRSVLLVTAVTLHNMPEGLAVGVAFGAAGLEAARAGIGMAAYMPAAALALGIGLQNIPEGLAVALPLRREGLSRFKAFMAGQASGAVEPLAGVAGAYLVTSIQAALPFALAFAAGAMVYVVIEELIPESQRNRHNDLATVGAIIGFAVMMVMDVALG